MVDVLLRSFLCKTQHAFRRIRETALLMVGVSDYNAYCEHMRQQHPELPLLTPAQWVERSQQMRHGGKKIGKCPC